MRSLASLAARIDALTLRERAFIMSGVLAVTYFVWSALLVQPMEKSQGELGLSLSQTTAEVASLNAEAQALLLQARTDPNVAYRTELESLKTELNALQQQLTGTTNQMVAPGQMARVLESVLRGADGLQVRELSGLGSSPLIPDDSATGKAADVTADGAPSAPARKVYKHGVKLVLQGDFFALLDFLRHTEGLDSKFFWDSLEFQVLDYPDATVEITVYTISLESMWIGA